MTPAGHREPTPQEWISQIHTKKCVPTVPFPTSSPTFPRPTFPRPTFPRPTFPHPTFPHPTFPHPTFPHPTFPRTTFPHTFPHPTFPHVPTPAPHHYPPSQQLEVLLGRGRHGLPRAALGLLGADQRQAPGPGPEPQTGGARARHGRGTGMARGTHAETGDLVTLGFFLGGLLMWLVVQPT